MHMKKTTNTIVTIVALLLLGATGLYMLTDKDSQHDHDHPHEYFETIAGEEVVLDVPLTESFSNEASNRRVAEEAAIAKNTSSSFPGYVKDTVVKPFTLGLYYLKNFENVSQCATARTSSDSSEEAIEYNEDTFKLTDVEIKDKDIYLYVDAQETPDSLCATVVTFKKFTSNIANAIHVVVDEIK